MTNNQTAKTLTGMRLPRVSFTYSTDFADPVSQRELPFVLGILADLSGHPETPLPRLIDRGFLSIDIDNFDTVLARIAPRLAFSIENAQLTVDLCFRSLDEFSPESIAAQVPALAELLERRRALNRDAASSEDPDLFLIEQMRMLDRQLSTFVNTILHSAPFQQLEAAWRGLHYLVSQTEGGSNLKILVFNITKKELRRDLLRASAFDQSILFKKVHDDIYGTSAGEPFAAFIFDFAFGPQNEDVKILSVLSNIAAAINAPCIAAASPDMFDVDQFAGLATIGDFPRLFEGAIYAPWRRFRESEDSRYVALTLPRILLRLPYGSTGQSVEAFDFEEDIFPNKRHHYLWGNAAYAFGTRLIAAFSKFGWCAAISGVTGGGMVDGLPIYFLDPSDDGTIGAAEIALTEKAEFYLAKLGFLPLSHLKASNQAAFFTPHSCHKPKEYSDPAATATARLFMRLDYILCASRLAHYLRCIFRDARGAAHTPVEWQFYFNGWISQYVMEDGIADMHTKARRPLTQARIEVTELPGKPASLAAVFNFHPRFQLEDPPVAYRIVATLGHGEDIRVKLPGSYL